MEVGFIGLGRMGIEMATRLINDNHEVIGFDISAKALEKAKNRDIRVVTTLEELCKTLKHPCVVWIQVTPGEPTVNIINALKKTLTEGDTIIDGGNSDFRESVRIAKNIKDYGINFIDVGVSGGVQGAKNGCGLLIGAQPSQFERYKPLFESLAAPDGYTLAGGLGAGHFAKAVHNGVEYAIMQAYGEGYELLSMSELDVDVLGTLKAYQNGCSIRSYILKELIRALEPDVKLNSVDGFVADSGMGRWTVEEATRLRVPTPTISAALQARFRSQQVDSPTMQSIAALRGTIGGHPVKHKGE